MNRFLKLHTYTTRKQITVFKVILNFLDPTVCHKVPFFFNNVNDHWGMANLDHRGIAGRIYVRNHLTLLHTVSSGPYGFSEEAF